MKVEPFVLAAAVAHAANRQFCATLGDDSQPSWDEAPQWQRESAINGVKFHVDALRDGVDVAPSASHDNWLAEKQAAGWVYGQVKNPALKQHPCCIPYDQLPAEQKVKDFLFGGIVKALYQAGAFAGL